MQWVGHNLVELHFPQDYVCGAIIFVHIFPPANDPYIEVEVFPVHARRGSVYLLTSDRLGLYKNTVFDMAKVGKPSEMDGLSWGLAYDQM